MIQLKRSQAKHYLIEKNRPPAKSRPSYYVSERLRNNLRIIIWNQTANRRKQQWRYMAEDYDTKKLLTLSGPSGRPTKTEALNAALKWHNNTLVFQQLQRPHPVVGLFSREAYISTLPHKKGTVILHYTTSSTGLKRWHYYFDLPSFPNIKSTDIGFRTKHHAGDTAQEIYDKLLKETEWPETNCTRTTKTSTTPAHSQTAPG